MITKWPTRLQKRLADAGDSVLLRERAEMVERDRWLLDAVGVAADSKTPGFTELPNRVGEGRRAGTLNCKTWAQFTRWLQATYGKAWPTCGARDLEEDGL